VLIQYHKRTPNECDDESCQTAGVTLLSMNLGQALHRTGFSVLFYGDDLEFITVQLCIYIDISVCIMLCTVHKVGTIIQASYVGNWYFDTILNIDPSVRTVHKLWFCERKSLDIYISLPIYFGIYEDMPAP
jgi:hypothetical protein